MSNFLNENVKHKLRATYPWIKFIAISSIALQGLSLIQNILVNPRGAFSGIFSIAITVALNVILLQYAKSLENTVSTGGSNDFTEAMAKQKSYWLFMGILMILALAIVLIGVIVLAADPYLANDIMRGFTRGF